MKRHGLTADTEACWRFNRASGSEPDVSGNGIDLEDVNSGIPSIIIPTNPWYGATCRDVSYLSDPAGNPVNPGCEAEWNDERYMPQAVPFLQKKEILG